MISKYVRKGDRIELKRRSVTAPAEAAAELLTSRVLSLPDEDIIVISEPWNKSSAIEVEIGEQFELRFPALEGSYVCTAAIIEENIRDGAAIYTVRICTEPKKNQRRRFFRVEKALTIQYHLENEEEVLEGKLINLSAGGMKFCTMEKMEIGKSFFCKLDLEEEDMEAIELECMVIDSYSVNNRIARYENRVHFVNTNREITEKIVKYVFLTERIRKRSEKDFY